VNDWPDQGYLPDNIDGRLLDPDGSTGSDICLGYDDDRVENQSGVIDQQDLDFDDIEDGSEAVERVARTTIAEQMGEVQVELVTSFFAEDVEKIKDRTYKMWLPRMKVRDEKRRLVGVLACQLFGVRFLIVAPFSV
jgi:hypothetical protein